jgi:cell division protein FtsA
MEGVMELAEEIFHMPVRVGFPQTVMGLIDIVRNPIYSTGVGLLHYGVKAQEEGGITGTRGPVQPGVLQRIKSWFQNNF